MSDKFPHSCHTIACDRPDLFSASGQRAACEIYAANNLAIQGDPGKSAHLLDYSSVQKGPRAPNTVSTLTEARLLMPLYPPSTSSRELQALGLTHETANECLNKSSLQKCRICKWQLILVSDLIVYECFRQRFLSVGSKTAQQEKKQRKTPPTTAEAPAMGLKSPLRDSEVHGCQSANSPRFSNLVRNRHGLPLQQLAD